MDKKKTFQMKFPAERCMLEVALNAISAYCEMLQVAPEEVPDIKTAATEAIDNAIRFAYPNGGNDTNITVRLRALTKQTLRITVLDSGIGIPDVCQARAALFTTDEKGDRSGMGFTIMEKFSDTLDVKSKVDGGTSVSMGFHYNIATSEENLQ